MMKKKSGFFTIVFSFVPGAGQMYQGYMKRGVSLMALFWAVILAASLLNVGELGYALPVIWFYSFFDALNIRGYTPQEWEENPDEFLFLSSQTGRSLGEKLKNVKSKGLGVGLIALGGYLLVRNLFHMASAWLEPLSSPLFRIFREVFSRLPSFAVAAAIILLGFYLIRGGKKEAPSEDDVTTYRG